MKKIISLSLSLLLIAGVYAADADNPTKPKQKKKKQSFYQYLVRKNHPNASWYAPIQEPFQEDPLILAAQEIIKREHEIRKGKRNCTSPFGNTLNALAVVLNKIDPSQHERITGLKEFRAFGPRPNNIRKPNAKKKDSKKI